MNLTLLESWEAGVNHIPRSRLRGLRPEPGQRLRVGVINGPIGLVEVIGSEKDRILVTGSLDQSPPPPLSVTLGLAYVRPKMFRRTFESCVEMGFKNLHVFKSHLCDKSYTASEVYSDSSLETLSLTGLQQSADTVLPHIQRHSLFRPLCEDVLLTNHSPKSVVLAHPMGKDLRHLASPPECVLVGPERGFSKKEVSMCESFGFQVINFGPRQLRYETAVPFLLGQLLGLFLE